MTEKVNIGTSRFTEVVVTDKAEFNANHEYLIKSTELIKGSFPVAYGHIQFQKGPIKENGVNGCHNEDLIAIVMHRLESFQNSPFACEENGQALLKLKEAMMWLNHRTQQRQARGVEGTHVV